MPTFVVGSPQPIHLRTTTLPAKATSQRLEIGSYNVMTSILGSVALPAVLSGYMGRPAVARQSYGETINSTGESEVDVQPSSTIIEDVRSHTATTMSAALAYFYFDFNDAEKQRVKEFICSIIAQLSPPGSDAAGLVQDLYRRCQNGQNQPSVSSLQACLKEVLEYSPQTFITMDALDECTQRENLLSLIQEIRSWRLAYVNILTMSRTEEDIKEVLTTLCTCTISLESAEVDGDIQLYINTRLHSDPKLKRWSKNAALMQEIQTALVNGAGGMFRWVVCQMDALGKCLKIDAVRKALKSLPRTLDDTYDRILNSIDDDYRDEAFAALQWLVFSKRPMSLEQVAEALSMTGNDSTVFDPDKRLSDPKDVLTICPSLVMLTKREGRDEEPREVTELRLAHFSVKEYLISQRIALNLRIEEIPAHSAIAKTCLNYLLYFDFELKSSADLANYPLYEYAAMFWPAHARVVLNDSHEPLLESLILDLLNPNEACLVNSQKVRLLERPYVAVNFSLKKVSLPLPLYYASFLGLSQIVSSLIINGADINAQGGEYGNALQAAAHRGNETVTKLLLNAGADIHAQGGKLGNALQAAALNRDETVLKLLLDAGADLNAQGGFYGNALQAAAISGNETVTKLLLDAGADINAQGGEYGNALQAAAISGNETVTKLLLDAGANINAQDGDFGNALQAAAINRNETVIRLLLDAGADLNAQGGRYGNALQAAAYGGNETVTRLLLDAGADINTQGGSYGTALQAAACRGHEKVTRLLLDAGADINAQGGEYGNALQAAAINRNETVTKLLLDAGADINAQGGWHGNALQAAAYYANETVIKLLLDAGADINAQGGEYGTALKAAIEWGEQPIIDLLVAHGAKETVETTSQSDSGESDHENTSLKEERHSNADLTEDANAAEPVLEEDG